MGRRGASDWRRLRLAGPRELEDDMFELLMVFGVILFIILLPLIAFGAFLNTPVGAVVGNVLEWGLDHIVIILVIVGIFAIVNLFAGDDK